MRNWIVRPRNSFFFGFSFSLRFSMIFNWLNNPNFINYLINPLSLQFNLIRSDKMLFRTMLTNILLTDNFFQIFDFPTTTTPILTNHFEPFTDIFMKFEWVKEFVILIFQRITIEKIYYLLFLTDLLTFKNQHQKIRNFFFRFDSQIENFWVNFWKFEKIFFFDYFLVIYKKIQINTAYPLIIDVFVSTYDERNY